MKRIISNSDLTPLTPYYDPAVDEIDQPVYELDTYLRFNNLDFIVTDSVYLEFEDFDILETLIDSQKSKLTCEDSLLLDSQSLADEIIEILINDPEIHNLENGRYSISFTVNIYGEIYKSYNSAEFTEYEMPEYNIDVDIRNLTSLS